MKIITPKEYQAIHPDYRGVWSGISGQPEWIGRRSALSGSLGLELDFLAIEGVHFLISDKRGLALRDHEKK